MASSWHDFLERYKIKPPPALESNEALEDWMDSVGIEGYAELAKPLDLETETLEYFRDERSEDSFARIIRKRIAEQPRIEPKPAKAPPADEIAAWQRSRFKGAPIANDDRDEFGVSWR